MNWLKGREMNLLDSLDEMSACGTARLFGATASICTAGTRSTLAVKVAVVMVVDSGSGSGSLSGIAGNATANPQQERPRNPAALSGSYVPPCEDRHNQRRALELFVEKIYPG